MDNTVISDAEYHDLVAVGLIIPVWLLIGFLVKAKRTLTLVRWMKFLENLVLGGWVGFIAADVAILASALPYIYTRQEDHMRCGSLGISTFAIVMISQTMMIIVVLAAIGYGVRACISATIRKRGPVVGPIVEIGAIAGGLFWCAFVFAGATIFAWFLEWLTMLVQNPPPLPPNLSDIKACSQFIGEAAKPPNFDPFGVWFRILR